MFSARAKTDSDESNGEKAQPDLTPSHATDDQEVSPYWWVVVWRPYGLTLWGAGGTSFTTSPAHAQLFSRREALRRVRKLKRRGIQHGSLQAEPLVHGV